MAATQFMDDLTLKLGSGVLSVILVVVFAARGIHRLYPAFFCYCIFDVVMTITPFLPGKFNTISTIHSGLWMLQWPFYFLLVLELIDRILSDHRGLSSLGKRAVQVMMVAATSIALLSLKLDSNAATNVEGRLHLFFQTERVIAACLLVFLVLINLFLWYFPVRLSRNTKAYCWGFTLFFLVKAIAPVLVNWSGLSALEKADQIHLGGMFLCELAWILAITKRGAERTPAFPRQWTAEEQEKVLSTLTTFEQQISRTRGR